MTAGFLIAALSAVIAIKSEIIDRRARKQADEDAAEEGLVPARPLGVLATLPSSENNVVGRGEAVSWIVEALDTAAAVAVVGRRGIGTSSCAIKAANEIARGLSDGQVAYLNLRAEGKRLSARAVLARLARRFGTRRPGVGHHVAIAAAAQELSRHLHQARIRLVLDNVDSVSQVAPLLPPLQGPSRLLLVGSPALVNAPGVVRSLRLEELSEDETVEMFAAARARAPGGGIRDELRSDPDVRQIVELCGRQPRTVCAVGYRMIEHRWRPSEVLETLERALKAPPHRRLSWNPVVSLLTERDVAYASLTPAAARLFRRLSLAPGPLDHAAIAAVSGSSVTRVRALVDELVAGRFLQGAGGSGTEGFRYQIRPLLAPYARLHLRHAEPIRRRIAAQARLVRRVARQAERHAAQLAAADTVGSADWPPASVDNARDWFRRHRDLLHAMVVGSRAASDQTQQSDAAAQCARATPGDAVIEHSPIPGRVRRWWFRLAVALCRWHAHEALCRWHAHEARLRDWNAVCHVVLGARAAGDRPHITRWADNELGVLQRHYGVLQRERGDRDGSGDRDRTCLGRALMTLTRAVARRGRRYTAQADMNLALALLDLDRPEEAIEHLILAQWHRSRTDRVGHALTDLAFGVAHLADGEQGKARRHLVRAANTFHSIGDTRGYAAALSNLGNAQWRLGERLDAEQSWMDALREHETVNAPRERAVVLLNAGAAMVISERRRAEESDTPRQPSPRARRCYDLVREGLQSWRTWPPSRGLGRTLLDLGKAAKLLDRLDEARRHCLEALEVCEQVDDAEGAAAARAFLGELGGSGPDAQPRLDDQ
ncbi:MAG: hypothetical protein GEU94_02980 [Micromonosporaceae bacterium]|nr:hypothetical protein [Micromonosporaceae bacterium]